MTTPSPEPPTPVDPEGDAARRRAQEERFGPLALERTQKDDGRVLIVFRDAEADPE
jgi:hypothetical protein